MKTLINRKTMNKLFIITMLSIAPLYAMDQSPIITLPITSAQSTPRASFDETSARQSFDETPQSSARQSFDSDFSSCEISPRKVEPKSINECLQYLKSCDFDTLEIFDALLQSKKLNEVLSYGFGFSLYADGMSDQRTTFGVRQEYFLTDHFKAAVKQYFTPK
jgi:hypothetical protein